MSAMRGPGAVAARGTSQIDQLSGTVGWGHSYFRNCSQAIITEPAANEIVVLPIADKPGYFEPCLVDERLRARGVEVRIEGLP
jgi:hypothetical protein